MILRGITKHELEHLEGNIHLTIQEYEEDEDEEILDNTITKSFKKGKRLIDYLKKMKCSRYVVIHTSNKFDFTISYVLSNYGIKYPIRSDLSDSD